MMAATYLLTLGLCLGLISANAKLGKECVNQAELERVKIKIQDDYAETLIEIKRAFQAELERAIDTFTQELNDVKESLAEQRQINQRTAAEMARLQSGVIERLEVRKDKPADAVNVHGTKEDIVTTGGMVHLNGAAAISRNIRNSRRSHIFRSRRQTAPVTKVAFSVALEDLRRGENLAYRQIIQFDKIVSNLGGAYNALVGTFTAPTSGWYALSLTFMAKPHEVQELEVVNGGTRLFQSHTGGADFTSVTKTVIVHLDHGSEVWVRTATPGFSPTVYGHGHTTFSGWLVYFD